MAAGSTSRLDVPLTVRQAAQMAGISTLAMRRMLRRFGCVEAGIMIRSKTPGGGVRWGITSVNDLRRVWPSFARKQVDEDDIEELREAVEKLTERLRIHEQGLRSFRARANEWFRRFEKP